MMSAPKKIYNWCSSQDETKDCQEQRAWQLYEPSQAAAPKLVGPRMLKIVLSLLNEHRTAKFCMLHGAQVNLNTIYLELQYPIGRELLLSSQFQDPFLRTSFFSIYDILRLLSYTTDRERYVILSSAKIGEEERQSLTESVKKSFEVIRDVLFHNTGIDVGKVEEMKIQKVEKHISDESLKSNIYGASPSHPDVESSDSQKSKTWRLELKRRIVDLCQHIKLLYSQDMQKNACVLEEQLQSETRISSTLPEDYRLMTSTPVPDSADRDVSIVSGIIVPNSTETDVSFVQSQLMLPVESPQSEQLEFSEELGISCKKLGDQMKLFDNTPYIEYFEETSSILDEILVHLQAMHDYIIQRLVDNPFELSSINSSFEEWNVTVHHYNNWKERQKQNVDLFPNRETEENLKRFFQLPGKRIEKPLAEQIRLLSSSALVLLSATMLQNMDLVDMFDVFERIRMEADDTVKSLKIDLILISNFETSAVDYMQKDFVIESERFIDSQCAKIQVSAEEVPNTLFENFQLLIECNSHLERHFNILEKDLLPKMMKYAHYNSLNVTACISNTSNILSKCMLSFRVAEALGYDPYYLQAENPSMITSWDFEEEVCPTNLVEVDSCEERNAATKVQRMNRMKDVPNLKKLVDCSHTVLVHHQVAHSSFVDTEMQSVSLLAEISDYCKKLKEFMRHFERLSI